MSTIILCLILSFLVMFLLMFLGVPVGWSMMGGGIFGFAFAGVLQKGLYLTSYTAWSVSTTESLICIPLYLLMGHLLFLSGLTSKIFEMAMSLFAKLRLKGALAMAVVMANALFGAVSGSIAAAISTMTPVAMPEASRYGYNKNFMGATLAMAGSLASLIPPSLNLIMYGILTQTSIAKLFIAGIVPGIILSAIYIGTIYFQVSKNPALAPMAIESPSWGRIIQLGISNIPVFVVMFLIIGGIYLGWFTPTESAGVGAATVLVMAAIMGKLKLNQILTAFLSASRTLGMILVLLIGAFVAAGFLSVTQTVPAVTKFIVDLQLNKYVFLLVIWILYFIMGCFIITGAMMVLTLPIVFPIVVSLGIDPIWFGIFCNLAVEVAEVTPPVGLNVYTTQGVADDPEVTAGGMFRHVWLFVGAVHVLVFAMTVFPEICLWLPGKMG